MVSSFPKVQLTEMLTLPPVRSTRVTVAASSTIPENMSGCLRDVKACRSGFLVFFFHVVEHILNVLVFLEFLKEFVEGDTLLGGDFLKFVGNTFEFG